MPAGLGDRRRFTAALLGRTVAPEPFDPPARVVRGVLVDISPHLLSLATPHGDERFVLTEATGFWRGTGSGFSDLRPGQDVIVRCVPEAASVAERVWSGLARATGVIAEVDEDILRVDTGHDREPVTVVIPYRASGRMQVRHPRLEPGYLFDAVGLWDDGVLQALLPATSQPHYPAADAPRRPPVRSAAHAIAGMVSWYDPARGGSPHANPMGLLGGLAYPALDRAADCGAVCDRATGCAALPLLSLGATVGLVNQCTGESAILPVVACGAAVSHFCDRCVTCDSPARGRIAQLTLASFIALGGRPEAGCFNATLTVG
ncbi:hypothetical protein [Nocardiopsis ansamitocini]|uniref:Uncharacterized protein n=1 Tax=Nocardiopsis ansamitocini TaxID=1670832 RepID=A0A9W6P9T5_9ACTN|nr:hypothetical protein [Nocardiopsis ansamitocini]GLU49785.1 hypothetical protein Nans01_41360 [Nocardiopsis ansamitocini]